MKSTSPSPIVTGLATLAVGWIIVANLAPRSFNLSATSFFVVVFAIPMPYNSFPIGCHSEIVPRILQSQSMPSKALRLSSIKPNTFHSSFTLLISLIAIRSSRPNPLAPTIIKSFTALPP